MGASAYWYYVPFETDYNAALEKLRVREFNAGRYNPVIPFPEFPITEQSPSPGPQHAHIDDPLNESDGDGTRSILDITMVSEEEDDCYIARILTPAELLRYFGTEQPSKADIEKDMAFFDDIERGQAFCVTVYKEGKPDEIYFVGYSFD